VTGRTGADAEGEARAGTTTTTAEFPKAVLSPEARYSRVTLSLEVLQTPKGQFDFAQCVATGDNLQRRLIAARGAVRGVAPRFCDALFAFD
jgi:hypothetical protein